MVVADRPQLRRPPPAAAADEHLPPAEEVADLFVRRGEDTLCPKSTVTFAYFAQWFTDGFLRSDRSVARDPRRNDATHEIDLLPIYGVRPSWTEQLRAHEGGRLKSQLIDGAEFPPFLYDERRDQARVQRDQGRAPGPDPARAPRRRCSRRAATRRNSQLGFVLMNMLFLREHNRIAGALAHEYPSWDDERLFQTARNILIVLLIKIVIEEYINHIAPYHFKFVADPKPFKNEPWYRPNWMAIEFNLLYRWHGLIPTRCTSPAPTSRSGTRSSTRSCSSSTGSRGCFEDASRQRAGRDRPAQHAAGAARGRARQHPPGPRRPARARTTTTASWPSSRASPASTRSPSDPESQAGLRDLYGHVDRIEFFPGLFAEDIRPNSVLPSLIGRMVGIDAFSQALTNPLLSPRVFNAQTFSPLGMEIIATTNRSRTSCTATSRRARGATWSP